MVAVLLAASALDWDLGLPTCLAALAITAVVCIQARSHPWSLLKEISWATIALVAGLFIMVEAVQSVRRPQVHPGSFARSYSDGSRACRIDHRLRGWRCEQSRQQSSPGINRRCDVARRACHGADCQRGVDWR